MPASKNSPVKIQLTPELKELKTKIHDQSYLDFAIDRIATIMSRHIVESRHVGNGSDFMLGW